jgi:hypothetical protein
VEKNYPVDVREEQHQMEKQYVVIVQVIMKEV